MYETPVQPAERPASLTRAVECQLFLTYLVQQMRNAPSIIHQLDQDELRQLAKAAEDLHAKAQLALDIAIAHQVSVTEAAGRLAGA